MMSPHEAEKKVEEVHRIILATYEKDVKDLPIFAERRAATLSKDYLKFWTKYWYSFAVEVNTGMGTAYPQFVGCFKRHPGCEDRLAQKIGNNLPCPSLEIIVECF